MEPRRGSAEYVLKKLVGEDPKCEHVPLLVPGHDAQVPQRLGFFFENDPIGPTALGSKFPSVLNLDVGKLCRTCYEDVVPDGFVTWSMDYGFLQLKKEKRKETRRFGYLPQQCSPGPYGDLQPHLTRESGELKPFGNNLFLPEAFAFLQHLAKPFYIDVLNLSEQWDFNASEEKQKQQLERVGIENGLAYDFADIVFVADASGGYGPWTTAEQRRAREIRVVPGNWRDTEPGRLETESEKWSFIGTLPPEGFGYPWPDDPNAYPIDSRPIKELLQRQIQLQPNLPSSYLSNADRVIEGYYRENPSFHYKSAGRQSSSLQSNALFAETPVDIKGTRWPEEPEYPALNRTTVDEKNRMMGPGHDEPGEWERAKYAEEAAQAYTWDNREHLAGLDENERVEKLRKLYEARGVPEEVMPHEMRRKP
ncbi:uncharacterized protein PG998_006563 [Apiospora kogelbergensis]|uniref:uncharacterized protein n=1 Tax=Apiospora kogelbergensis TaxID=1337665 RepID=UPI00313049D9